MKSDFKFLLLLGLPYFIYGEDIMTPTLAYKTALENSDKVIAAKYQYESKKENLNQVYAKLYPQINSNISYGTTDYQTTEIQRNKDVKEKSLDYTLSLTQSIYDHELLTRIDSEKKRVELSSFDYDIEKQKLAVKTLEAYMNVLNTKNKLNLLEASLDLKQQNLKSFEKRFEMNLVNKIDLLNANLEYQKAKIDYDKDKKFYEINFIKLQNITKIENIQIPDIQLSAISEEYISKIKSTINEIKNVNENLIIKQSSQAVQLSDLEIKNAQSKHFPRLSLNSSYTDYNSNDATADYENYGKVLLRLDIPLYSGGGVTSEIESKKLLKTVAIENLKDKENEMQQNLDEVFNSLIFSLESVNVYKNALSFAEVYLQSVEIAFDKGLKNIVELYDAKNKLFEIKYGYIKNIQELSNYYVQYLVITNNLDKLELIDQIVLSKEKNN